MTDLELSIYEAEECNEIDEDVRDMMLEMVAMEYTAKDNRLRSLLKQRHKILNEVDNKYKMMDSYGKESDKYNKIQGEVQYLYTKYNKLIDEERNIKEKLGYDSVSSSDSNDFGKLVSSYISRSKKTGSHTDVKLADHYWTKGSETKRKEKEKINSSSETSNASDNKEAEKKEKIRQFKKAAKFAKKHENRSTNNKYKSLVSRVKNTVSNGVSNVRINAAGVNAIIRGQAERELNGLKDLNNKIKNQSKNTNKKRNVKESVDNLKMDIYESERYGEISIEERDELLSYLD